MKLSLAGGLDFRGWWWAEGEAEVSTLESWLKEVKKSDPKYYPKEGLFLTSEFSKFPGQVPTDWGWSQVTPSAQLKGDLTTTESTI